MAYLREPEPEYGRPVVIAPGVRRVVARNPGLMTYHGTNAYILETPEGRAVLDPGPDDAGHVAALLAATEGRVDLVLLTHWHHDHIGAAPALAAATGARMAGFRRFGAKDLRPDVLLDDGAEVAGLTAVHTPGHAADHLCFARPDGILFSGDHVMSWSSSVVPPPPLGDMADYCASLERLMARADALYLPGHGPPLPEPRGYVAELLRHRVAREEEILATLREAPREPRALVELLYARRELRLRPAAERNVLSHLDKLAKEGRARSEGDVWSAL